jgi:hypothetical protein
MRPYSKKNRSEQNCGTARRTNDEKRRRKAGKKAARQAGKRAARG